mgnify:CR=1 FL=1
MKFTKLIPIACVPAILAPLTSCTKDKEFIKQYDIADRQWTPENQVSECELSIHQVLSKYMVSINANKEILADDIAWSTIKHAADTATGTLEVSIKKVDKSKNYISVKLTNQTDPYSEPSFYELNNIEMYGYYGPYIFDQSVMPDVMWQIVPWALHLAMHSSIEAAGRYLSENLDWSLNCKLPGGTKVFHYDHTTPISDLYDELTVLIGFGELAFESYYLDPALPK